MPNEKSTPPPAQKGKKKLIQTQLKSDTDLATTVEEVGALDQNINSRHKRPRIFGSPTDERDPSKAFLVNFKNDLLLMLEEWKSEQRQTLAQLVTDVTQLKTQCLNIQQTNTDIERSMVSLSKDYEDILIKVSLLEQQHRENTQYISKLEARVQDLQQRCRPSAIEIRNVPSKSKESTDDLMQIAVRLGQMVQMEISASNVRDIYRLPGKPGYPRSIFVEFSTVLIKNNFLAAMRNYNKKHNIEEKLHTENIGVPDPVQVKTRQPIIPDTKCSDFQSAMKLVIIIGQCFALNPVSGVCEKDANNLRFKYFSWRCLYTFLSLLGQCGMICIFIISLFKTTTSIVESASSFLFYSLGISTTVSFLRIAMKWPKLCKKIYQIEADDPTREVNLSMKLNVVCFLVLALAALEHIFAELHGLSISVDCGEPGNGLYESHARRSFPWVFISLPYSDVLGFISHFINIQCTFNWNFTDLFVICVSLYLTSRLEQVNNRVMAAKDKNSTPSFWRTMREDYNRATYLVRQVDSIIGGVIFISFASNLFFVCSQLMHILSVGIRTTDRCNSKGTADERFMSGYEHSVYYVYSFVFLVARSLAVSLAAARVHSASLEPAYALYNVSSGTYCVEIERFLNQIHGNTVALTGLQFFSVKRGIILTIAGTIVTYELVLMQFTGVTPTSSTPT